MEPSDTKVPSIMSRRAFLTATASVAVGALAACDSTDDRGSGGTQPQSGDGSGSPGTTGPGSSPATTPAGQVKRGGTLKIGVIGDSRETLDAQHAATKADQARLMMQFEPLAHYDSTGNISYEHGLAETIEMADTGHYTITLKPHAKFSDGKNVTAADVLYSIRRRLDETSPAYSASLAALITPESVSARGDQQVVVELSEPNVTFLDAMADYMMTIVPDGYTGDASDPATQIGSGPFVLTEFTPGQRSVHHRNPDYWWNGDHPYLDEIQIIDYADQTALIDALTNGQVDAIIDVPHDRADEVAALDGITLLDAPTGSWLTITMAIDQAPFDDPDVREALRLIADRQALVDTVVHGFGTIANDLYSPLDRNYARDITQRPHDPDKARDLLTAAGHTNLTLELYTPDDTPGLTELATAYAAQAANAGVTINVTTLPGTQYWAADYTRRAFATDYWPTRPYLTQTALASLPTSPYNTTHWPPEGSDFNDLYHQAITTDNAQQRHDATHKMQQTEWDQGGHIIPFFHHLLDAHTTDLHGLTNQPSQLNLNHYGHGMKQVWLDRD